MTESRRIPYHSICGLFLVVIIRGFVILFGSPGCLIVGKGFVSVAFRIISESFYAVFAYIRSQTAKWIDG